MEEGRKREGGGMRAGGRDEGRRRGEVGRRGGGKEEGLRGKGG